MFLILSDFNFSKNCWIKGVSFPRNVSKTAEFSEKSLKQATFCRFFRQKHKFSRISPDYTNYGFFVDFGLSAVSHKNQSGSLYNTAQHITQVPVCFLSNLFSNTAHLFLNSCTAVHSTYTNKYSGIQYFSGYFFQQILISFFSPNHKKKC